MEHGFQGLEVRTLPDLPDSFRWSIYQRYAELYSTLTGKAFIPEPVRNFDHTLDMLFEPYLAGKAP